MKLMIAAFASILLLGSACPRLGADIVSADAVEAYWKELAEASEKLLRQQAVNDGLALNGVEFPLLSDGESWTRGAPVKDRTRLLVNRIEETDLAQNTGLEYRGYLYLAEATVIGATVSAYGHASLEIDGESVVDYLSREATVTRVEYLELAQGHHSVQVQFASRLPGGALAVSFGPAADARFRIRVDLPGMPADGEGPYRLYHAWDPANNRLPPPARLAALAGWLRVLALSPGKEDEVAAAVSRDRSQFPPEANPYLLFLQRMAKRLKELPKVRVADPEPATSGDLIARASGGRAFLFLAADRMGHPQVLPSVLVEVNFPSGERLFFPRASKLRLAGNRPRILPVGMSFGRFKLVYSTAQPLAVFEDQESYYLVGVGEEGERVEYAFAPDAVKSIGLRSWMGDLDVKYANRTIVAPADGRGHFRVMPHEGKDLIVKTIDLRTANDASVWRSGRNEFLVISKLTFLRQEEDQIVVQMPPSGYDRLRVFPGSRVSGIECEGEHISAERLDDWAEIRFSPPLPPVVAKRISPRRVELMVGELDASVKDIYLNVRYEGKSARAYAGGRLIARSDAAPDGWRFSVFDALQAGERALGFEFDPEGGRLLTVDLKPVVEKRLKFRLVPEDTD